jgi:transcriptional regulator EpsA
MDVGDPISLRPQETENLLHAIDKSMKVFRRSQFFLWAQGSLQGPLPHETLICAWGEIANARYQYEVFSRTVLDDKFSRLLADPVDGLLSRLVSEWLREGRRVCVYSADTAENRCPPALSAEFRRHGFRRVVAHGLHFRGGIGSFFVFINGPARPAPLEAYFTEMLVPHLHITLHRVAELDEDTSYVDEVASDQVLSGREIQVLNWVRDGKTNQEIAMILDISPLTVKNHMQKILRKLNVSNRAQAVAWAIAARILTARGPHDDAGGKNSALATRQAAG